MTPYIIVSQLSFLRMRRSHRKGSPEAPAWCAITGQLDDTHNPHDAVSLCSFNCVFSSGVNNERGLSTGSLWQRREVPFPFFIYLIFPHFYYYHCSFLDWQTIWPQQTQCGQTHLRDKLSISSLLSLHCVKNCLPLLRPPKLPTGEDIVRLLNFEGAHVCLCVCVWVCMSLCVWMWSRHCVKKVRNEGERKESHLVILSLRTLCFVLHLFTEFPHWLGGCGFSLRPELA